MPSLHMLGHMVAMAVIATLVKQIMELNAEVNKLKGQLGEMRDTLGCAEHVRECDENNKNTSDTSEDAHNTENEDELSDKTGKESRKNDSVERGEVAKSIPVAGQDYVELGSVYSSVWCHDGINQVCQFENICYNSKAEEFALFKHKSSTFENVKIEHGSITMDLSSVKNHNAMDMSVISLPSDAFSRFKTKWINETTLVFKPFLSGNLMHMFHDDIIPLHHTLKLITMGDMQQEEKHPFEVQLFIFDDEFNVDDEIKQFYEVFSRFKIKSKTDFQDEDGLICFRSIFIGLSKTTTWYDYGFSNPQGPLSDSKVDSSHINSAVSYLRQHLPLASDNYNSQEYVVMFTRKENRKIMNDLELTLKILRTVGMKVMNLNFESYSVSELISYTSKSKGVIAMHGSLLILSMFLKPGSFVMELFPYAVNPSNYTPYKTLSQLKGMGLIYKSWTNHIKENSIGHPDWPPESGGLNHLEEDEREIILQQTEVLPHLCCDDPSWLYHIYQDTFVNTSEISTLVKEALSESRSKSEAENNTGLTLHPSRVQNVSCNISHTDTSGKRTQGGMVTDPLKLKWNIPWTTFYMELESLHYEILLQNLNTDSILSFKSRINKLAVEADCSGQCYVWVRAVINNNYTGPYSKATFCHNDLT
ncbi:protein O-linked-mannose beta-1,4-N-acetylglucosaminyltransferase 2-like [Mercenaria mercenaria]|uniref:protein O-linked-mannose beta-1,4-N-acetylglucosaminyltransferase 2-like n=1 Tax=Mercenaria mercenaria TaxID=6596 RepID=UPI00234E84AE|nr:protein O-linked-mannose beta-1,4-N-acetylglucosaminyltransferase 2-like [Mercenaria mercenaria]XP_045193243.2 protein O-linked-mannose beta-1,4-N-acetylglucosaminyltransferase 2-like [Mercenaria mercenaria]